MKCKPDNRFPNRVLFKKSMTTRANNRVTLRDVAGALGMDKSTVSNALSGKGNVSAKTRARIATVARELGYEPNPLAQRLATGHQNETVCLFSGILDTGITTDKVLLIQQALAEWEMEAPIYACGKLTREPARAQLTQIRQLRRQQPRAILCAAQLVDVSVYAELATYQNDGGLVISYDTPSPLDCDQVIFDREDNTYQAARHLLLQGHRRIAIGLSRLVWRPTFAEGDTQQQRLRGFARALEEFGVLPRPEWQFRHGSYERGGEEMARQFLSLAPAERPTGLCIVNDHVALAFMAEVMRAGVRIPDDLSVIGHDNQPLAAYCPVPLTSMTQPTERIASTVVEMLMDRIRGSAAGTPPQKVVITSELVQRASVASLRHP